MSREIYPLLKPETIQVLNDYHTTGAAEEKIRQFADTPTLKGLLLRQLAEAEADLVQAARRLLEKYTSAMEMEMNAVELTHLIAGSDIHFTDEH
jgi:hypothetical protein